MESIWVASCGGGYGFSFCCDSFVALGACCLNTGICFELCKAEELAPRQILHCNAEIELDCGVDSDYYYTN